MRTLSSELIRKGLAKKEVQRKELPEKKNNEKLTDKEWQELMGCNRHKYFRSKGGAYKQR